jgi:lipoate-protein ligase A
MSDRCDVRLIVEPVPRSGDWNMALDRVLLDAAVLRGDATLRWYSWEQATLSLGYFQSAASVGPEWRDRPVVQRPSGGGAIVHHHDLTYSLALPAKHPLAAEPLRAYRLVHEQIRGVLEQNGISVALRGSTLAERDDEFLCFARAHCFDIVAGSSKIFGSAQRRRKGALLQHGSLLLARSEFAPSLPGLAELGAAAVDQTRLCLELSAAVCRVLGVVSPAADFEPFEIAAAREILPSCRVLGFIAASQLECALTDCGAV